MKTKFFSLLLLVVTLAACGTIAEGPPTPTPTPLANNAAWTPVIRVFNGVEMVLVPPGCFQMGHADGRRDEQPVHQICFGESFWIDRYEVTNAQFGVAGAFTGDNHPRENLTWFEARDFCASRDARLPTEAEWEYAARGIDSLIYPWGNEMDETALAFDRNNANQTFDVGSYPQGVSWVGAYDMVGNVWEWVSSVYLPYPYENSGVHENSDDAVSRRVFRGGLGSYIDYGTSAAKRFRREPDERDWFIGFRCARDNH